MDISKIYQRTINLILKPASELRNISRNKDDEQNLAQSFILFFASLIALCTLVENTVQNIGNPGITYVYVAINGLIVFLLIISHIYVSGKAITFLTKNIAPVDKQENINKLVVYSQVPFLIVLAIIKLFPPLIFLSVLGLYSGYLFYTGSYHLTKIPPAKRMQFSLLSIIILIAIFLILSELFTLLYSEIIAQFSTFAAQ